MWNRTLVLALIGACLFAGYQAAATRNLATPTRVAVVQLRKVMDSIQQRAVIDMRLKELEAELVAKEQAHKDGIAAVREKLKAMVGGDNEQGVNKARELAAAQDPAFTALTDELETKTVQFAAWQRSTVELVDIEKSLVVQDLYRQVKEAIASLAEAEGYDLVLIDDSQGDLQINPDVQLSREGQVFQQVSLRKVLYASSMVDITDDLIVRMNNAFDAGGNKVGAKN